MPCPQVMAQYTAGSCRLPPFMSQFDMESSDDVKRQFMYAEAAQAMPQQSGSGVWFAPSTNSVGSLPNPGIAGSWPMAHQPVGNGMYGHSGGVDANSIAAVLSAQQGAGQSVAGMAALQYANEYAARKGSVLGTSDASQASGGIPASHLHRAEMAAAQHAASLHPTESKSISYGSHVLASEC